MELQQHVEGGLNHGLTREEIDEIMVQLAPYVGLPLALSGAGVVGPGVRRAGRLRNASRAAGTGPRRKDRDTRRRDGMAVLRTLLGAARGDGHAQPRRMPRRTSSATWAISWSSTRRGDVWSRPQLSRRDRSLIVISALAAQAMEHELEIHLRGAMNHGVTPVEIEEVMLTLVVYAGFPKAINGIHLARRLFAERDAD